jgi:transposase
MSDVRLDDLPVAVLVEMVRALQAQVAALQAELATLRGAGRPPRKTAANSSLPPAKGFKARRPDPPPGTAPPKRGPKPGHPGVSRARGPLDQVQVLPCRPHTCTHCGAGLAPAGGVVVARRQVTDLPPVPPVVVEAQRWRVRCRHCGHGTVGAYPDGFGATGAFGPRLVATAALLHEEPHVAYARLVEVFGGLFGLRVSEGALVEAVGRLGQALMPAAAVIAAEVRTAKVIGSDETSARVDGVTWWEWVFQTVTAAYHTIQRRRTTEVALSFLDGVQPAVWVSDLWQPQLKAPSVQYQIWLAHQLRDLRYAEQAETGEARAAARAWAMAMATLLRQAIHIRHQHEAGDRDASAYAAAVAGIAADCDVLLAESLTYGWSYDLQTR